MPSRINMAKALVWQACWHVRDWAAAVILLMPLPADLHEKPSLATLDWDEFDPPQQNGC